LAGAKLEAPWAGEEEEEEEDDDDDDDDDEGTVDPVGRT
jgi:hypothetical protein